MKSRVWQPCVNHIPYVAVDMNRPLHILQPHVDGLVIDCSNFIANALQSYTKPSIYVVA